MKNLIVLIFALVLFQAVSSKKSLLNVVETLAANTNCKTAGMQCKDCEMMEYCSTHLKPLFTVKCTSMNSTTPYCDVETNTCTNIEPPSCDSVVSDYVCPGVGTFPDLLNCKNFFNCDENFVAHRKLCAEGTKYDQKSGACIENSGCFSFDSNGGLCTGKQNKFIEYPPSRDLFVLCAYGRKPIVYQCPHEGDIFKEEEQKCEFECALNGFFPHPDDKSKFYSCTKVGDEFVKSVLHCYPGTQFVVLGEGVGICLPDSVPPETITPTDEPNTETPVDNSTDTPVDNSSENPTDNSSENPTDNSSENPVDNSSENPVDNSSENPTDNSSENPTDNSSENPTDNSSENPTDNSSENPTDNSSENPTDNSSENPGDTSPDAPENTTPDTSEEINPGSAENTSSDAPGDTNSGSGEDTSSDAPEDTSSNTPGVTNSGAAEDTGSDSTEGAKPGTPTPDTNEETNQPNDNTPNSGSNEDTNEHPHETPTTSIIEVHDTPSSPNKPTDGASSETTTPFIEVHNTTSSSTEASHGSSSEDPTTPFIEIHETRSESKEETNEIGSEENTTPFIEVHNIFNIWYHSDEPQDEQHEWINDNEDGNNAQEDNNEHNWQK